MLSPGHAAFSPNLVPNHLSKGKIKLPLAFLIINSPSKLYPTQFAFLHQLVHLPARHGPLLLFPLSIFLEELLLKTKYIV